PPERLYNGGPRGWTGEASKRRFERAEGLRGRGAASTAADRRRGGTGRAVSRRGRRAGRIGFRSIPRVRQSKSLLEKQLRSSRGRGNAPRVDAICRGRCGELPYPSTRRTDPANRGSRKLPRRPKLAKRSRPIPARSAEDRPPCSTASP